ncbi:MAG TPA: hypothetical protein VJJ76_01420 [archaeon]|nr:hypothetical protein [archaeon]
MNTIEFEINLQNCKHVFLPRQITSDLLYFVGVLVGDGSLPKRFDKRGYRKYAIVIEKANEKYVKNVLKPLAEKLFKRAWSLYEIKRKNRQTKYSLCLNSRPLYEYFSKVFEIPEGKKANKVRMPTIIRKLPPKDRMPFIAGIIDTDWGSSGGERFGTHLASKQLLIDVLDALEVFLGKKYEIREYLQKGKFKSYQTVISKSEKHHLFKLFQTYYPLRNEKRLANFINKDIKV